MLKKNKLKHAALSIKNRVNHQGFACRGELTSMWVFMEDQKKKPEGSGTLALFMQGLIAQTCCLLMCKGDCLEIEVFS